MITHMKNHSNTLNDIFSPRGVAVVGVSAQNLGYAEMVIHTLKEAGFPAIYPVNPKYKEVQGLPCYANLQDIPGAVDHVVVNIPAESALALLDDCAAKGVRSVHFFTAGFGESGDQEKAKLEKDMLDKAKAGGFRIIGPNCVGLYVPKSRLVNGFVAPLEPGPIACISQSGGHAQNIPYFGASRGLRFSKVISHGNALDVDECELLDYFAQDPETRFIAAYIEGVKDGEAFKTSLKQTAAKKPVVIFKGGRTNAGKRAALGHTASMTSSVAVFDALCQQTNAIRVNNIEELIDVLVALRFLDIFPQATGVALIGAGGGPAVLAGDEMEQEGLRLPPFSLKTQAELKRHLPVAGSIFANPLDTPNLTTPDAIYTAMKILGALPEIHMLVYHLGFHPIGGWGFGRFSLAEFLEPIIGVMKQAKKEIGKPILLALRNPTDVRGMEEFAAARHAFIDAGFPVFHSMGQLARALFRIVNWNRRR